MNTLPKNAIQPTPRWSLLRDLGILQIKLIVDGFRDLLLVPASLIAGIMSLATGTAGKPGLQFYRLLEWGKHTEVWINLFGAVKNSPERLQLPPQYGEQGIDEIVARFESFVVDEYQRGDLTKQTRQRLEQLLNTLRRKSGPTK